MDPLTACQTVYGSNPFPEAVQVGDYLKNHASPGARIAVLGSEPEIYFYHRHSATGYIYTYSLMEPQSLCLGDAAGDDRRDRGRPARVCAYS